MVPIAGSFIHLILGLWSVDILFLLGYPLALIFVCLAIEIIFTHLLMDISDFFRGIDLGSTQGTSLPTDRVDSL